MKHHYVPQFYQRGFIKEVNKDGKKEGLIWIYEKDKAPRKAPVKDTGMGIDLYALIDKDGNLDNETVEAELGKIDNRGAAAIHKLEKGAVLSNNERRDLCKFISIMYRRTPKFKEYQTKLAAQLMPEFFETTDEEWLRQLMQGLANSPAQAESWFQQRRGELAEIREEYLRHPPDFLFSSNLLRESAFEKLLFDMDWALFRSTLDTDFVTCDDPALFSKGAGLGDKQKAVVMFPLSRELFLQAMWISTYEGNYVQLTDTEVRKLNRDAVRNAGKEVYASHKSSSLSILVDKWIGTVVDHPNKENGDTT
jgi:Protein of unknown function (DUF4238)